MHPLKQRNIGVLLLTLTLSACESWQPGDDQIYLTAGTIPQSCHFRGNVDSRLAKAPLVSHQKIEDMQSISLKNQALKMQANIVQVTVHETTYYMPYIPPLYPLVLALKSHHMAGKAYQCDAKAVLWVRHHTRSVSDVRRCNMP